MGDDTTIVLTDIKAALASAESEAAEKPAALLVVGGELNGTIFDLQAEKTIVGRNPDCTIPLEFNGISRKHRTGKHEILPYQQAFFIAHFIEEVVFINATAPNTEHIHIGINHRIKQLIIVVWCDFILKAILRNIISTFGVNRFAIHFKIKAFTNAIFFGDEFNFSNAILS